jgi:hypothetical protein
MPDYSFVDSVALERIQYRHMRLVSGAPPPKSDPTFTPATTAAPSAIPVTPGFMAVSLDAGASRLPFKFKVPAYLPQDTQIVGAAVREQPPALIRSIWWNYMSTISCMAL